MGCKFGCVCGGNCCGCSDFVRESYCGEAEDYYDKTHGIDRAQEEAEQKEYDDYCEREIGRMEQEYYEAEYAEYISEIKEQAWREEQFE